MILLIAVNVDDPDMFKVEQHVHAIKETAEAYAKNSDRANHYHGEVFKGAKSEMGNLVSTFTVLDDTEEMFVYRAHNVLDKFQLTKGLELKNLGLEFVPAAVRIFKELIRLCN
jgi:hypothetical protein